MWQRRFTALTAAVEIASEAGGHHAALDALFGSYPGTGESPQLSYRVSRLASGYRLECNHELLEEALADLDVGPTIELDLFRRVVEIAQPALTLHAAAVAVDGGALVLVGPSGAGKTTITRALIDGGGVYLSDECVSIDDDGVVGLSRGLYLGDEAPERGAERARSYDWVDEDGHERQSWLLHPPAESVGVGRFRVRGIFLIEYRPEEPGEIIVVEAGRALAELWEATFAASP
ncbi:MAG: hypothetical protein KJO07_23195, partial [Deltaproteobacteria bacterium]|nr:hypothetical protein [Deltaproteobacteria bacterium]